jgi:thymidylate synthase (FAD)
VKVTVIAYTVLSSEAQYVFDDFGWDNESASSRATSEQDTLAEFAGRLCYESWSKPNPKTATNRGYLQNIIEHKHYSTLEHASVTLLLEGVSRSLTHELVRHRHLSFSQVSQRYVDHGDRDFVGHPLYVNLDGYVADMVDDYIASSQQLYSTIQQNLRDKGFTKKEANGAARQVLPEGTETKILVSGNLRTWMEVIDKRYSVYADQEIRELAEAMIPHFKEVAPNIFQDVDLKDFTDQKGVQN